MFATFHTTTPMRISLFCLTVNVVLAAALVWWLKQAGLGIANTASAMMNMTILFYALRRKLKTLELAALRKQMSILTGAAVLAGAVAWTIAWYWGVNIGHGRLLLRLGEVFVPIAAATAVYLGISVVFKTGQVAELLGMFRARLGR